MPTLPTARLHDLVVLVVRARGSGETEARRARNGWLHRMRIAGRLVEPSSQTDPFARRPAEKCRVSVDQ